VNTHLSLVWKAAAMAEVLLFHHAQGQTAGFHAFADELRHAGHRVHTPDLYEGRTFDTLEDGLANVEAIGFHTIIERGVRAAEELPAELVYAGFSLGVVPAQMLAQNRPGARGALLLHSCLPTSEFGAGWPAGVPVQIHAMEHDPFFTEEGDIDAARALVAESPEAELFLYPGSGHLFADPSLPSYDPAAAALLTQRVLEFLA
jgi:dienelactone hydrolase